jgi:hypothetical protein
MADVAQPRLHARPLAIAIEPRIGISLQAMRGVALVVAVTVVAEVGGFRRFANARQLMAYLA